MKKLLFILLITTFSFAQSKIEINPIEINSNKKQNANNEFIVIQLNSNTSIHSLSNFNYLVDQWISIRFQDAQDQSLIQKDKII